MASILGGGARVLDPEEALDFERRTRGVFGGRSSGAAPATAADEKTFRAIRARQAGAGRAAANQAARTARGFLRTASGAAGVGMAATGNPAGFLLAVPAGATAGGLAAAVYPRSAATQEQENTEMARLTNAGRTAAGFQVVPPTEPPPPGMSPTPVVTPQQRSQPGTAQAATIPPVTQPTATGQVGRVQPGPETQQQLLDAQNAGLQGTMKLPLETAKPGVVDIGNYGKTRVFASAAEPGGKLNRFSDQANLATLTGGPAAPLPREGEPGYGNQLVGATRGFRVAPSSDVLRAMVPSEEAALSRDRVAALTRGDTQGYARSFMTPAELEQERKKTDLERQANAFGRISQTPAEFAASNVRAKRAYETLTTQQANEADIAKEYLKGSQALAIEQQKQEGNRYVVKPRKEYDPQSGVVTGETLEVFDKKTQKFLDQGSGGAEQPKFDPVKAPEGSTVTVTGANGQPLTIRKLGGKWYDTVTGEEVEV